MSSSDQGFRPGSTSRSSGGTGGSSGSPSRAPVTAAMPTPVTASGPAGGGSAAKPPAGSNGTTTPVVTESDAPTIVGPTVSAAPAASSGTPTAAPVRPSSIGSTLRGKVTLGVAAAGAARTRAAGAAPAGTAAAGRSTAERTAAEAPAAAAGVSSVPTPGVQTPGVIGAPRSVRLTIARIDPWSTLKLSFLLSIALGVALVTSSIVVWEVLDAMGIFSLINDQLRQLGGQATKFDIAQYIGLGKVVSLATFVAVINVVIIMALSTLSAVLYNIAGTLVGGLQVTLSDD